MSRDPDRKQFYDAIYPPDNAIKIWRTERGWSVFFPEGTPQEAKEQIRAAVERLHHEP